MMSRKRKEKSVMLILVLITAMFTFVNIPGAVVKLLMLINDFDEYTINVSLRR